MKIVVCASNHHRTCPWQVQLDQQVVGFRSEVEARAFVASLQARLNAPHSLMPAPSPGGVESAARR